MRKSVNLAVLRRPQETVSLVSRLLKDRMLNTNFKKSKPLVTPMTAASPVIHKLAIKSNCSAI